MADSLGPLTVRIAARKDEAVDVVSFELVSCDGQALPAFSAGSHIDVAVPGGWTRQYSLCNDPAESHRYQIAVLHDRAGRGGSAAMHERMQVGDMATISTPKNHFVLAPEPARHLLLAGGIGITPILCMAERLATLGADFELHYCTRSRDRTAFHDRIGTSSFVSRVQFHFDDGPATQRLDIARCLAYADSRTHLYVCGPKGFMDAVLGTARGQGWPEDRLHYEFFGVDAVHRTDDGSFEVVIASSGRVVVVEPNQSVVQALAVAGIVIPTSCEQGVCGTCMTRIMSGVPDHRDHYLTPDEQATNQQFMACCSRAVTPRLVLDL